MNISVSKGHNFTGRSFVT
ncbi:MAG TPA: hypothetical protein DEA65_05165 [Candidatus Marinimicrobia bacterium]|nr:hypothetical protein [Candidatus Neomarinimicrobiota bacterium]